MTDLKITTDWTWAGDEYRIAYAETNDPRVLAIIEREDEYGGGHIDGDVYAPAFYYDHQRVDRAGSTYADDESDRIAQRYFDARYYAVNDQYRANAGWPPVHTATSRNPERFAERFLRIFYDTTVAETSSSIEQGLSVYVFNTPTYRKHIGNDVDVIDDEQLTGDIADWTAALDGDVYGIGYAVLAERVDDEVEINEIFDDFEQTFECWGFLGEDYAKQSAAAFEHGWPELPELLDLRERV